MVNCTSYTRMVVLKELAGKMGDYNVRKILVEHNV